jgi:hypothetical protein
MPPAGDRLAAKPGPEISHLGLSQSAIHMQEMLELSLVKRHNFLSDHFGANCNWEAYCPIMDASFCVNSI